MRVCALAKRVVVSRNAGLRWLSVPVLAAKDQDTPEDRDTPACLTGPLLAPFQRHLRKHGVIPKEMTAKPAVPPRPRPDSLNSLNSPTPRPQAFTAGPCCPQPQPQICLCLYLIWGSKSQIFIQGIFNSFVADRWLLFYSDASAEVTGRALLRALDTDTAAESRGAPWVRSAWLAKAPWRPCHTSAGGLARVHWD